MHAIRQRIGSIQDRIRARYHPVQPRVRHQEKSSDADVGVSAGSRVHGLYERVYDDPSDDHVNRIVRSGGNYHKASQDAVGKQMKLVRRCVPMNEIGQ